MEPHILLLLGGSVVVANAVVQVGTKIITDRILNNGNGKNGFCSAHKNIENNIQHLSDMHKEEKQLEIMTNAMVEAMKRSGIGG